MTWVMGGKASQTYDMLHLMSTSGALNNWNSVCMHTSLAKMNIFRFEVKSNPDVSKK